MKPKSKNGGKWPIQPNPLGKMLTVERRMDLKPEEIKVIFLQLQLMIINLLIFSRLIGDHLL